MRYRRPHGAAGLGPQQRRRAGGATAPPVRQGSQPVLRLQEKIGNRATAQVLARQLATATTMGTIQVDKLPTIKIWGGNVGGYSLDGNTETRRVVDWGSAHRTTITHHSGT